MELFISSTFDAIINVSGQQIVFVQNDVAKITTNGIKDCLISVLPINESNDNYLLPYCFKVDLTTDCICDNEFCDVVKYANICCIRLLPKSLSKNQLFANFSFANQKYIVTQNNFTNEVVVRSDNVELSLDVGFTVKNFNFYHKQFAGINYAFLEFANTNNAYLVVAKDVSKPILSVNVNSYEWKDNIMSVAQKFDGELSQIKISKYLFDTDCKRIDEQIGYVNNKPCENIDEHLLPYIFLEGIIAGNVNLAKTLLTNDFGANLSLEMMQDFFPKFDAFCEWNGGEDLSYDTVALLKKGHLVGILKFEIENNKIANIKSF